jgi:hypothetical protein
MYARVLFFGFLLSLAVHAEPTRKWASAPKPPASPAPGPKVVCDRSLENFSKSVDGFPTDWTSHSSSDLRRARQNKIYEVTKEDSKVFLRAIAKGDGVILHRSVENWDLSKYPLLRWKWRVRELPMGGSEDRSSTNDAGAAVYVIWKASMMMRVKSIKMTWSSTLTPGTHIVKRFGLDHVHVLRQGPALKNQWVEESIDLQELAKLYYPEEKNLPIALAIMSDGDNTESPSAADYADFELCHLPSIPEKEISQSKDKTRDPARE